MSKPMALAFSLALASGLFYFWRRRKAPEATKAKEVSWADRAVQAAKDAMSSTGG